MSGRSFLVFEVPAEYTRVGAVTKRRPGCTVDLVGKPLIREEGHAYLLHYIVRGIDDATRLETMEGMGGVYEHVETLAWDPARGVWEVRGVMAVEKIHSPGLRFVAGLFGLAEVPWVEFRDGVAEVRLYPKRPEMMPHLAESVDARLASMGIGAHPRILEGDVETYRRRAAAVGVAIAA